MTKKEEKEFKRSRVRTDLKIRIRTLMLNFNSDEEPSIELTGLDNAKVLTELLKEELNYLS